MKRTCDGTDPNLTRQVPEDEYAAAAPGTYALALNWKVIAQPGHVVVQCQCGTTFDDVACLVVYPHAPLPPKLTDEQLRELSGGWPPVGRYSSGASGIAQLMPLDGGGHGEDRDHPA